MMPALRFASLGSGSSGNATVVSCENTHLLVDCGFSLRETRRRLARLGLSLDQISAVVVTHEHGDHIRGIPLLARACAVPVYMTAGTREARDLKQMPEVRLIQAGTAFLVDSLEVLPVSVPHDAREPVQYIVRNGDRSLGILTDLGSFDDVLVETYSGCDSLLLEANHDPMLLSQGPYPPQLKRRVGGPWGHLSNQQAAAFLMQMDTHRLHHLVVGHISRKNNSLSLAQNALACVSHRARQIHYACQDVGFGWLELS
jgi:phosphoribosyl 1,2-cyclic phosphodiesterase